MDNYVFMVVVLSRSFLFFFLKPFVNHPCKQGTLLFVSRCLIVFIISLLKKQLTQGLLVQCFQELFSVLENKKHQKLVWLRELFLFLLFLVFSKWHCLENNKMLFSSFFYCLQNKIKQQKNHLFSVFFFFFSFSSLSQHSRVASS